MESLEAKDISFRFLDVRIFASAVHRWTDLPYIENQESWHDLALLQLIFIYGKVKSIVYKLWGLSLLLKRKKNLSCS